MHNIKIKLIATGEYLMHSLRRVIPPSSKTSSAVSKVKPALAFSKLQQTIIFLPGEQKYYYAGNYVKECGSIQKHVTTASYN